MVMRAKLLGREELTMRLQALVPDAIKNAEAVKLEIVQDAAKQIAARAPRDTGDYAKSIVGGYQRDNPEQVSFSGKESKDPDAAGVYGNFIWRWLEFGTRAHSIKPKNASILAFPVGGETQFAGTVWHPNTAAQPHIYNTWRELKPKAKRKIAAAINKAVRKAMGK